MNSDEDRSAFDNPHDQEYIPLGESHAVNSTIELNDTVVEVV